MKRLLAITLLLLSSGCARRHPNVVLVTFDGTRWDHVGYAARRPGLTPSLDGVAATGTWFSTCIATAPLTAPSDATILTGLNPVHHGVRNDGGFVLRSDVRTLAEKLRSAGYQTRAVVSSSDLNRRAGLDRGFDSYDDEVGPAGASAYTRQNAESTSFKAFHWVNHQRRKGVPFFLWVELEDPHLPVAPPREDSLLYPDDPYSAAIHYADRQLGRLIDTIKADELWNDTVFIFVSDHGESLGEHGEPAHGIFLYDSTTRVPLLISGPDIEAGRVDDVVSTADLAPTILALAGVADSGTGMDGKSLLPLIRGGHEPAREAYSESFAPKLNFGWSPLRSERSLLMRVVAAPRPEAYDEKADPGERNNLLAGHPSDGSANRLFAELARVDASDPLAAGGPGARALPDPKDRLAILAQSRSVGQLIAEHNEPAATNVLRHLLELDPGNPAVLAQLGEVVAATGDPAEALHLFEGALAIVPGQPQASAGVVRLLRKEGRFAEAEPLARKLIEVHPSDSSSWIVFGGLLADMGRLPDAESAFRKATSIDPGSTEGLAALGNALHRQGKESAALSLLETAQKDHPQSQEVAYNLGLVYDAIGKRGEAEAAYRKSIAIDGRHSMSWNNLGSLLDREGKRTEAIDDIRRAHTLDPANTEATYNLGALLLAIGKPAEALPLLEQVTREKPGLVQGQVELAAALEGLGRDQEAITVLRRLAATQPGAFLRIAMIEWQEGKTELARRDLDAAKARGGPPIEALIRKNGVLAGIAGNR